MSEISYRIEHFEENLGRIKGKRIFLYGGGKNTKLVIENFDGDYRFCGIILPDDELSEEGRGLLYGKKTYSLDEALAEKPEIILLGAQMYSAFDIYGRISGKCFEAGAVIMDLYGYDEKAIRDRFADSVYLDLEGWKKKAADYDVISFEVKETLIATDILKSRKGRIRPVFRYLIPWLEENGKTAVFIAEDDAEAELAGDLLSGNALMDPEKVKGRVFVREERENFFRKIKEIFPGKKYLHVGREEKYNCVFPTMCGFDTWRMVWYEVKDLTSFIYESREGEDVLPDIGEFLNSVKDADTVSFDIFDTLIARRVADFRDVFVMAALRALDEGVLRDEKDMLEFLDLREKKLNAEVTYDDIYEDIGRVSGISRKSLERLKELEFDAELKVICARAGVKKIFDAALRNGKRVVLTTDMYYTVPELQVILDNCGIKGYEKIFVSSEKEICKRDGLFHQVLRELGEDPERMVHIGDDPAFDIEAPLRYGIRTLRVLRSDQLALAYGVKIPERVNMAPEKIREGSVINEYRAGMIRSVLFGIWAAGRFDEPFKGVERTREDILERYGKCAVWPVIAGWFFWLAAKLIEIPASKVLFVSRDGYLPKKIYDSYASDDMPASEYFYNSRHASFLMNADREELSGFVNDMTKGMSGEEILRNIYDIEPPEQLSSEDKRDNEEGKGSAEKDMAASLRENYKGLIAETALNAREGYYKYSRKKGIKPEENYIYADFIASGTSQRMLEEAAGYSFKGLYFGRPLQAAEMPCDVEVYITGKDRASVDLLSRYIEMEYYMTSSEPSLRTYDSEGNPVFSEEVRSPEAMKDIGTVQKAVTDLFSEFDRIICLKDIIEKISKSKDPDDIAGVISSKIPAEMVSLMYLVSEDKEAEQRYFDDWSLRWI